MQKNQVTDIEGVDIRELAALCDKHAAAFGDALRRLHVELAAARQRNNNRGPSGTLIHAALERCTRKYLSDTVMRGLPGSPRLPKQSGFKETVERWLPSLSTPATSPPPSLPLPLPPTSPPMAA